MSLWNFFVWTADDAAFEQVKKALVEPSTLAQFDPPRKTVVQADMSHLYGVGYTLLQEETGALSSVVQGGGVESQHNNDCTRTCSCSMVHG